MTNNQFCLTEDDLTFQNDVRVHLDVWLKTWEWEEILKNQKIVARLRNEVKRWEDKRKSSWYPSKKRGMMYNRQRYLEKILLGDAYHHGGNIIDRKS